MVIHDYMVANNYLYYKCVKGNINGIKFIEYLKNLKKTYSLKNKKKLILFMDNASIHTSETVREYMKNNNITPLYNIPYNPQSNPIEKIFSKTKFNYNNINCIDTNR